jgi:hypothetical protein
VDSLHGIVFKKEDNRVVRFANKVYRFLNDKGNENVLLIMPNDNDGFKLAGNILSQSMEALQSSEDCLLFLADGGTLKTKTAQNFASSSIVQYRYCVNISGKLLTKLGRAKKRDLRPLDVKSPIIMGSPTFFAKCRHQNKISFNGSRINLNILGVSRLLTVRRAIIYSKYLFQASRDSKLYTIAELRRSSIPITYIGTDADDLAIDMIQKTLLTENVFGFTNETLNKLGSKMTPKVDFKSIGYAPASLNPGIKVPDPFSDCDAMFANAQKILESNRQSNYELSSRQTYALRKAMSIYRLLKASSVPALDVKYYSDRANVLHELQNEFARIARQVANEPSLMEAAMNIETAIALSLKKVQTNAKSDSIKNFINQNKAVMLVTWSKPEAEVAKNFFGVKTCSTKHLETAEHLLFGGLWSTWRFLDAIRQANPVKVDVIGWEGEVEEYTEFCERYAKASNFLYNRALEVDRKISGVNEKSK